MIREVHPRLFVGDSIALNDLITLAGYAFGALTATCSDCGQMYRGLEVPDVPARCLDCAKKHVAEYWFIIHAAKEPWHRDALGYTERGAPPAHPEYLVARRGNELCLNLVDMKSISPQYTNPIVEAAFSEIDRALEDNMKVLIHCNEGKSRAPTLALLWLGQGDHVPEFQAMPFDYAVEAFRKELYPEYEPGAGMEAYARERWGYVEEAGDGADAVA